MKRKAILFYAAALLFSASAISVTSCNSDVSGADLSKKPPVKRTFIDTTKLLAVFLSPDRKNLLQDIIFRVRFDSAVKRVPIGENTYEELWGVDSAYFIPRVDTIKDAMQRPVLDSTGRAKVRIIYDGTFKELVWESNITVDSAIKKFKNFLVVDSVPKK